MGTFLLLLFISVCFSFSGPVLLYGCCGLLGVHFRPYSSDSLPCLEVSLKETGEEQRCVSVPYSGTSDFKGHQPDAGRTVHVQGI